MIALGSAAGVIRWAAMPYADGVAAFTLLQVMHALTFGATHLGTLARDLELNGVPLGGGDEALAELAREYERVSVRLQELRRA